MSGIPRFLRTMATDIGRALRPKALANTVLVIFALAVGGCMGIAGAIVDRLGL